MVKVSKYSIKSEHGTIIRSYYNSMIRSSDSKVYYKKAVLKSSKHLTGKNLCMSLFLNNVADLWLETFFRKRLLERCVPVSFVKYSIAPFMQIKSG